jgi:hypothetical protein
MNQSIREAIKGTIKLWRPIFYSKPYYTEDEIEEWTGDICSLFHSTLKKRIEGIKKKKNLNRTTDEKRYPVGWNSALSKAQQIIDEVMGGGEK